MTDRAGRALRNRFVRHLTRSALLRDRQHLLVALSGGLDSVTLLHLLRFGRTGTRITAAHFDHALRADSARDADWVRGLCTAWDVPLISARAPRAPRNEEEARTMRYAFLHECADRVGADAVLTAHHADDQAETVLFRLARGTGVPGLRGIPQVNGRLVRPLLPFLRAELLAYARVVHLPWRNDATNTDVRYARNRIRHHVLPPLERVRPGATRHIARLAARVAHAERAWDDIVASVLNDVVSARNDDGYALARDRLLVYHPHIRARVIRHLLHTLGGRASARGIRSAMAFTRTGASGAACQLAGGFRLERELDRFLLRTAPAQTDVVDVPLQIRAAEPGAGTCIAGGHRYVARWTPAPLEAGPGHTARFDPSSLRFPLTLRAWRAGDRIRLAYGSKKLKKLFLEQRVERARRRCTPVLVDAGGDVLWVVGHARSQHAPAQHDRIFEIRVGDGDTE